MSLPSRALSPPTDKKKTRPGKTSPATTEQSRVAAAAPWKEEKKKRISIRARNRSDGGEAAHAKHHRRRQRPAAREKRESALPQVQSTVQPALADAVWWSAYQGANRFSSGRRARTVHAAAAAPLLPLRALSLSAHAPRSTPLCLCVYVGVWLGVGEEGGQRGEDGDYAGGGSRVISTGFCTSRGCCCCCCGGMFIHAGVCLREAWMVYWDATLLRG